ncbi:DnaB-like helicase C-terminal domain-containing protein [Arcobacter cloacae]|uniref:DNA 5'-3' helicase n=1 Tax=Arcobacter cloacae TaxID=1054034 RepID=A0A6M8NIB5_9BACT|nr:DnaB-like helicase C-terminal domain-containing protein [Arcobacter cloacae]QKF91095.1 replicative DNA helicase [Arcobacter cloacae]RXI38936.1 replicative DNA helicase [Arcobacter cloacae]
MDLSHSLSIERLVLSSIIFNPDEIYYVSTILEAEDFYLIAHQEIYKVMLELLKEDMPIDEDFIRKRLNNKEISDEILINILSANPITNIEAYCIEIKEDSKVRKIQELSKKIPRYISENSKSEDILFQVQKDIEIIENKTITNAISTDELISQVIKDMEDALNKGSKILGQSSGLKALDGIIGAFEDGDLIVIAARPSIGKTSLISAITIQALMDKNGVLIESLEMPAKKIMTRLIAAKSEEGLSDLKKGLVRNKNRFKESIEFFTSSNLIIHDKSYPTLTELQNRIKTVLRKNPNIKNVFVDHTGKIQLLGKTREDIEIGQISAMLKKIARDYNIRVFLLQQLNRSLESRDNKRPILSDLKNSGNIEEDADIVLGLYRDSYYKKDKKKDFNEFNLNSIEDAEIIVLKNRDGRLGTAKVSFESKCTRFIDKKEEEPLIVEFE